ncbi:MAG: hypothetical protein V3575_02540 [Candidatus Absconditabacteria bacterium]
MKKIILLESLSKKYINIQNKVRKNNKIIDGLKMTSILLVLVFSVGIYGYLVNVSSTKGYFLRQEMKKLEDIKFNNSITQLEVLGMERQLWDSIQSEKILQQKKITINSRTLYVQIHSETNKLAKK